MLLLERHFYGLRIEDVRRLAYQPAERNELKHNFNAETEMGGKKWFYSFMKRHPELSVRQPESTSMARVKGFIFLNVHQYFDRWKKFVMNVNLMGPKYLMSTNLVSQQCRKGVRK